MIGVTVVLAVASWPAIATAASVPSVTLDRSTVRLGQRIIVSLHDWPRSGAVVISVCGNQARRGSVDCNLADSQGIGVTPYVEPVTELIVKAPPGTCPCVIRVSNSTQDVVAFAPITIVDMPSGPVVGNVFEPPLTLDLRVRRAPEGLLSRIRSSLGGPTAYELTVVVRNKTAEDLRGVRLIARAGRHATDQARIVNLEAPDVLSASQSWTHVQRVTLAAPVVGRFVWTVSASGVGGAVRAEAVSNHTPFLLLLIILIIAADVAVILGRRLRRRRASGPAADAADAAVSGVDRPETMNSRLQPSAGPVPLAGAVAVLATKPSV
jgi:hypothetical protein